MVKPVSEPAVASGKDVHPVGWSDPIAPLFTQDLAAANEVATPWAQVSDVPLSVIRTTQYSSVFGVGLRIAKRIFAPLPSREEATKWAHKIWKVATPLAWIKPPSPLQLPDLSFSAPDEGRAAVDDRAADKPWNDSTAVDKGPAGELPLRRCRSRDTRPCQRHQRGADRHVLLHAPPVVMAATVAAWSGSRLEVKGATHSTARSPGSTRRWQATARRSENEQAHRSG